ncbi:hypothetical protein [Halalkalibacter hemicellulosilyticus]|uniref:Uncharacterized protein n=1 Tax=Halalkalibacter hemicellulosilyticusJCM 9152 TaxID=1236971 RepID=W4QNE4_9BACI|nr:hypothetical protein [Halalkalibacter hemicellulosilyticus]GAE32864.1 hypothetical protein JCM9152_4453 [Halalkalibacter hemicellulosilyticusJCM 9152]
MEGYLSQVRANGRQYWYLKKYEGKQEFKQNKERTLYKFGNSENAIAKLHLWNQDFTFFPSELKQLGYGRKHVNVWIDTLKKKIS